MRAFNQVVAQQRFGWKTSPYGTVECRHIIDRLAVEYGFTEQVLLRIRYGASVRIGARSVCENSRKTGSRRAGKSDAHTRLYDRETPLAHFGNRIENRSVQRVRNRCDHLPRGARRQLSVCIQRYYEPHTGRQITSQFDIGSALAEQEQIEFFNLSALPFTAN